MIAVCATCGAHYPAADRPEVCRVCADDRQYVPPGGQVWTDPAALAAAHRLVVSDVEPGVRQVTAEPKLAIGQRGYVVADRGGAVLWDPPAVVDARGLGDVVAVAMSHPHYFGAMAAWAEALDVPVWVAEQDLAWVTESSERIVAWRGEHEVAPGLVLVRCGGHFPGSAVLWWDGGALFTGDTIQVVPGADRASFMYSYPNYLPLAPAVVEAVVAAATRRPFTRAYGAFGEITDDAEAAVHRSAARYLACLRGVYTDPVEHPSTLEVAEDPAGIRREDSATSPRERAVRG